MPGYAQPLAQAQRATPLNAQQDQQRNRIAQALMAIQRPPPNRGMMPGQGGMGGQQRPMPSIAPGGGLTPPGSPVGAPAPITGIGQALGATGGPAPGASPLRSPLR